MSMFYHCPICWDGEETCKCTAADFAAFENRIAENKKEHRQKERKRWHGLLDKSLDLWEKGNEWESFETYFARLMLKSLTRGEWNVIKESFDIYYGNCPNDYTRKFKL